MPSRGRKRRNYGSTATHQLGTSGSGAFEFQGSVVKHGAQEHKYESLNYDRCENAIYRKALRDRFTQTQSIKAYSYTRWVITFFIGVLTGLVAFLIDVMTEHVFKLKFEIVGQSIERCEKEGCLVVTLLIFVGINAALVFVAAMCVVVEPVSAGSGIPEVKTYLNGIKVAHIVRLKTLICKALGVACSVSGGLPCGKEGPMIHCGSVIAAGISQGKSTSLPVVDLHFNMFRTDRAKRDFVSSGAAAGVAAAFGAPIGGVMFALEEGSSFWNQQLTWRSFFAAMMATFTLNLLLSGVRSHWGDLSFPGLVSFGSFSGTCQPTDPNCDVLTWQVVDLLIFLVLGACGGLLGALFNFINEHLTIYRMKHLFKRSKYARVVEALLVCSVTTLTMFCAALYLGSCKPVTSDEPTEFAARNRGYFCKEGEWNDMATLTYNSAESVIKMLFHKADDFSLPTLAYFFVFYFALACWTYGLGVPSGVFVPTLLTGACFGRLSAVLVQRAVDHLGIDYQIHYATYALIGAAAFLGGVVRMTISLTVILIETTNNVVFGLPLMMTLMVAKWVGDMFNEGIYMLHIELRQIPFLHWEPPAEMKGFYAAQVMAKDVVCVEEIERVADIEHLLRTHHHSAFPVVDRTNPAKGEGGHGLLLGIILRSQLVILLKHRAWGRRDGEAVDAPVLDYKDFISEYPRYPTIEHIHVPVEAHNQYIDLTPYMNPCPYVVQQISPLPRVFNLFRTMGLRHLPVVDRYNNLMGLITRKDLTNLEYRYSSDPDLETRGHGERLSLGRATSLLSNDLSMRSKDFFIAEGDVSSLRSFRGDPRIGFSRSSSMLEGEEIHGHQIAHSNTPSALSGLAINTNNNNNNINGLQNLI